MGDAEIIPLGTRGRPGRGSGAQRPSSTSRGLAAGRPAARSGVPRQGAPEAASEEHVEPVEPVVQPEEAPTSAADPSPSPRAAARTEHRLPGPPASSPGEWLAALTTAAKEVFGDQWEPRLAEMLAFLRRRLTGDYEVDDFGFDPELTDRFLLAAVRPLAEKWFRIEVVGADNIPAEGGALVVSNHSGTVPVDGVMTAVTVRDHTGRHLRALGADLVFRLPVVSDVFRRGGATLACSEDAERMLRDGELVGVWPEGFKGIGKPFSERYKLQRFGRGGFVSAAIRTGVPIVPTSVVGAEEIYPLVGNVPSLARLLGLPYLPITPLFPWLGPLGLVPLPSKWLIEFGEPIRTDDYDAGAADDPMLVFNVTDQVRESIQQTLYTLLMKRRSVFS
ncbi:lysophospholipid acyltransferase family protein [Nocardioides aequoreus]|uniref:lysophospholipid acyltransferase family protein n=1 Tax=Nocardioides aequoreus TaxID=397278 RepID=UPI0004C2F935|nr:lysophospholipid acyltransferase family protein [Nocardioides aequoreus]